jgi:hypothetical protein
VGDPPASLGGMTAGRLKLKFEKEWWWEWEV